MSQGNSANPQLPPHRDPDRPQNWKPTMTTPTKPNTSSGEARPDAYPIVSFPIEDAPAWARSGDGDGEVAVVYSRVESEHFTQKQCWHLSRTNAVALRDALTAYLETPTHD